MNCFLPWNLKDMTNISAEKLQKNISQQTSYIEMYRTELLKESLRFNVASLLRHLLINRSSLNTDDLSKRATDCLIVFLHATAFLKKAYFAPTDAENPAVGKCVRNLHRLMLENVKATMKYLDYYLLLDIARGKIASEEMFEKRKAIHDQIFPDTDIPLPFKNDAIGSEFLKLVEMENSQANEFSDFEVLKHCNLPLEVCQSLSAPTRRDDELPESRFGIIGSCRTYLDTPFIRYGNTYYSFVSSYCLKRISDLTENIEIKAEAPSEPEPEPEPEPTPEVEPEPVPEIIPDSEESDDENNPFDESDEIESESEEDDSLKSDDDSAYLETDEYEFPDEFEEDVTPASEENSEEHDVYEETEEIPDESIQPANPNDDSYYDEEPYTALVSPDTYEYLEKADEEEFIPDPMLEEQEELADAYDEYEEEPVEQQSQQEEEEEDPYSGSLFDILDDSDEETEPESEVEEPQIEEQTDSEQDDSFPPFEEEETVEEQLPEPEPEPVPETEPEPEPEPEPTPEPEPETAPATLPLLEQILSFSPSRNNPITQYLTNCTAENQKEIVRVIELARKSWLIDGKDKMFTIPETNISVAVFLQSQDPMKEIQRRENIGAVMYSSSKDNWNSLELSYDSSGKLVKADFNRISKSSFTDWEWKIVEKLGERIIERRAK